MPIAPIHSIIDDLRQGRMVVLVDEEDRENEGDLVLAADFVTPEAINFMAKFGRGLVCLTLTQAHCQRLGLRPMVSHNKASHGTNFTVSIEAAQGVSTGISAADRAHTIRTAVARNAKPADLVQPGHIFPLAAAQGGVLMRAGHTEAGCDLAALAGLTPAAVICEIMKDDGTMARLPDLVEFAKVHDLKIGTIADLIQHRSAHETLVENLGETTLHTAAGPFRAVAYRDQPTGSAHLALVHGTLSPGADVLVRVHEPTSVLDLLDIQRSAHCYTVTAALQRIAQEPAGVVVLLNCNASADHLLQQWQGFLPVPSTAADAMATPAQAAAPDLRTYGIGAQILKDLGVQRMRLLARPRKMPSMSGFGLEVLGYLHGDPLES